MGAFFKHHSAILVLLLNIITFVTHTLLLCPKSFVSPLWYTCVFWLSHLTMFKFWD
jgi:hypothetical protein